MLLFRSQKIAQRKYEVEQENKLAALQFQIENPQKYQKGQTLPDGTLVTYVGKIERPGNRLSTIMGEDLGSSFGGWTWIYEGVKDGKIISLS